MKCCVNIKSVSLETGEGKNQIESYEAFLTSVYGLAFS